VTIRPSQYEGLPFQVISTGLPYLILPLKKEALSKAKINTPDLEKKLETIGAKFAFIIDIDNVEGRTWDNLGIVEDIATGSSAGPVGAYLVANKKALCNKEIIINQGAFLGRPSKIKVIVMGDNKNLGNILVEGEVIKIAEGQLLLD
jgi:trans-2,3-dihydro-3-hydroxyanthranilate isomerase